MRDMWHAVDWSKVKENPDLIKIPRENWLVFHDCERFVLRMWDRAVEEMRGGEEIPHCSLAAGMDSDEFEQKEVELPPSPLRTPEGEKA